MAELDGVGELVAVGPEELDAVVLIGVVGGRDDDAEIGPERARQHGHGRRRLRPQQDHIHPHGDEACRQRRLQHIAGEPRILADDDTVAVIAAAELGAGGQRQLEGGAGRDRLAIGGAAKTVGAEELASHDGDDTSARSS